MGSLETSPMVVVVEATGYGMSNKMLRALKSSSLWVGTAAGSRINAVDFHHHHHHPPSPPRLPCSQAGSTEHPQQPKDWYPVFSHFPNCGRVAHNPQ